MEFVIQNPSIYEVTKELFEELEKQGNEKEIHQEDAHDLTDL